MEVSSFSEKDDFVKFATVIFPWPKSYLFTVIMLDNFNREIDQFLIFLFLIQNYDIFYDI